MSTKTLLDELVFPYVGPNPHDNILKLKCQQILRLCKPFGEHCWILEAKMDMALGLHFICPDGRGGHPLTVRQNIKDHLCSIIPWPIRWQGYDTLQMILNILGHRRISPPLAYVARSNDLSLKENTLSNVLGSPFIISIVVSSCSSPSSCEEVFTTASLGGLSSGFLLLFLDSGSV